MARALIEVRLWDVGVGTWELRLRCWDMGGSRATLGYSGGSPVKRQLECCVLLYLERHLGTQHSGAECSSGSASGTTE